MMCTNETITHLPSYQDGLKAEMGYYPTFSREGTLLIREVDRASWSNRRRWLPYKEVLADNTVRDGQFQGWGYPLREGKIMPCLLRSPP